MKLATLERLRKSRDAGDPVALVTDLKTGQQTLVYPATVTGDFGLEGERLARVRKAITDDKSTIVDEIYFIQVMSPPPRLIVVGAVHIAQALIPMASLAGYAITVIDPRGAFATDDRFPNVTLSDEWPDDAMTRLKPDAKTAVVTLTHDPKLDDPALEVALKSPVFYIGALGSTRTHAKRVERLKARGFDDAALSRIHAPIGLRIGAVSQSEIAVSILAQLTAVRRGGATTK
ncbi:MAG: XdhC family protein [Proteobacteria bacterium]|nr:XdhC family protein [Pseudomonadota bacterium]